MRITHNLPAALALGLWLFSAYGQMGGGPATPAEWQKAMLSLKAGNRADALEQFKRALGEAPDREMLRQAGRFLRQAEGTAQAEELYLWGREALGDKELFAWELGEIYQQQLKYREAVREFGRSPGLQPARVLGKFEELSLQAGVKAVAALAENEVDAGADDGKWLLGELFRRSGDISRAWHYQRGIKDEKRLRLAVGLLTARPGPDPAAAAAVIAEYLEKERPDRVQWEMKLADLYLASGGYREAERILAPLADKKIPQAQLVLAGSWLKHRRSPGRAMALIEGQKRYWPDSLRTEGDFTVCLCLMALGEWDQAEAKCAELAEGKGQTKVKQRAYYLLGEIKLSRNQADEALKHYGQAAKVDDEGTFTNDALARILLISQAKTDKIMALELLGRAMAGKYQGDPDRAGDAFQALVDSAPGTMSGDLALWELAEADLARGRYQQAAGWLKRLAEISADSLAAANAYYRIGQIYSQQIGNRKAALEFWRTGVIKYPNTSWAELMRQALESAQAQ